MKEGRQVGDVISNGMLNNQNMRLHVLRIM